MIDSGKIIWILNKIMEYIWQNFYWPCVKMSAFFVINFGSGTSLILVLFSHMSWKCPWIFRSVLLEKLEKCPWTSWNVLGFDLWIYDVVTILFSLASKRFRLKLTNIRTIWYRIWKTFLVTPNDAVIPVTPFVEWDGIVWTKFILKVVLYI